MHKGTKKIPNIGLFIPTIDQYYERELLSKLFSSLETRPCNLHVFCGQTIPAPDPASLHGDLVTILPNPGTLDGLIVTTASAINYAPLDRVTAFIDQYRAIPVVSMSYPLENTYNILLNNKKGIEDLTTHLIKTHGLSDIVHIAGPKWSLEAQDRAKAFLFTLQRHGLVKDNKRIIRASFTRDTGKAAALALLKDYEKLPEAVVCCSDEVAFGFMQELESHGIHVPGDLVVTGYDNIIWSRFSTPAITTASQPLDQMMRQALSVLLDIFEGKTPQKDYVFEPELIIRESCSCRGIKANIINIKNKLDAIDDLSFESADTDNALFQKNRALILKTLKLAVGDPATLPKGADRFLSAIFEALVTDFCQNDAPALLAVAVERFYIWSHHPLYEELSWKTLDFTIERILRKLFPQPEKREFLDYFCLQFVYEVERIAHKIYTRDHLNQTDLFTLSHEVINHFSTVTSYEQMLIAFRANCELLNFKECYCCMLDSPVLMDAYFGSKTPRKISVVFGKYQYQFIEAIEFTTETLLPQQLLDQGSGQSLAYFPLNTGSLIYGYFACDIDNMLRPLASTIRQQVSSILDRLDLLDKLEEDTQKIMRISLQDALTGLLNRRGFFEKGQRILLDALKHKSEMVLLFGDMDGLKTINDTYGHQSGDTALKSCALCLKDALREGDIISRFGGDEFALLLHGSDNVKNVDMILKRIHNRFDEFNGLSTLPYDIHVSFGYTIKQKSERKDLETMIEEADQRLYSEKKRRRTSGAN